MADDASKQETALAQLDDRWVPLQFGPFYFRRRSASIFDRSAVRGHTLAEIVEKAAASFPFADPDDPNPHAFQINEGEGCIWARWTFGVPDGSRASIVQSNYWADNLETAEPIECHLQEILDRDGLRTPKVTADLRQGLRRLEFIWSRMKEQFWMAAEARVIRIMARRGDPLASFEQIAPDSMRHYKITDWYRGTADMERCGAPALYSIHIDPLNELVPKRSLPATLLVAMPPLIIEDKPLPVLKPSPPAPLTTEAKFLNRLKNDMEATPVPDRSVKRKGDYLKEAMSEGLTERAFDRLWSTAVRDTGASAWSKGGAPTKNKSAPKPD